MTRIQYDRERLRLTMEGHAGAGPKGGDPVCAALSMLMMTLEARMTERAERRLPVISRGQGRFEIQSSPEAEEEALCRESFDTVAAGFALLAENSPAYVTFRFMGEEMQEEEDG